MVTDGSSSPIDSVGTKLMKTRSRGVESTFTWADYRTWPDSERWEIIGGAAYDMAPAPSTMHQMVVLKMSSRLEQRLSGRRCKPFIAPTDVKLSETDVVQPDILVVCDPTKITASHIEGPPDLIIEVLSPATATRDLREKKALYESTGVREYVVVDPLEQYAVRVRRGDDGLFDKGAVFGADEVLNFMTLEGIEIPLWEVFDLPEPSTQRAPD